MVFHLLNLLGWKCFQILHGPRQTSCKFVITTGDKNEKECLAFRFLTQSTSPDLTRNMGMWLFHIVSIPFRGDISLSIVLIPHNDYFQFLSELRSQALQGIQCFLSSSKSLKLHALPLSLYVLPIVSLNEL